MKTETWISHFCMIFNPMLKLSFAFPEMMAYADLAYAMAPQPMFGVENGGRYNRVMFA